MPFEAVNLKEEIGAEIFTDAETLARPEIAAKVRRLLIERGVLVLRGINLTDAQQVALAGAIGKVRPEGENGIYKVTLDTRANASADYLKGSFLWHMDGTHDDTPIFASLLSGRKLSDIGGQTEFANTCRAYETLSPEMKRRIDGLRVVHSVELSMMRGGVTASEENLRIWRSRPHKTHSLVWTRASGRKSLVIGSHASHIDGMDPDESRELLQELIDWTTQPARTYRHEWTLGDLLIWDNTGVLHRAEPYPVESGRMMHRTTLLGEEAFS
jgi:alpha-ketoglutarate-dependent taurine dioxygenase